MRKILENIYPFLFISVFFGMLLLQLSTPNLTLIGITENFLWRQALINNLNNLRYHMGDRVFAAAVIGKDGWMYYTEDQSIEDYQKTLQVPPRQMRKPLETLALMEKRVRDYGGRLIVVVIPDKHTVYPQFMPEEIPVLGKNSRLDQVLDIMDEGGMSIEVVDLRQTLLEASSSVQIYQKADTHWNCIGAYYAYQEVMNRVSMTHPESAPHSLNEYKIKSTKPVLRDIPSMLGIDHLEGGINLLPRFTPYNLTVTKDFTKTGKEIRIVENENKDLPTALVFHDSFYVSCFNRLFEQHFSRTYALHYLSIEGEEFHEVIDSERAEIVVIETVERYLVNVLMQISDQ